MRSAFTKILSLLFILMLLPLAALAEDSREDENNESSEYTSQDESEYADEDTAGSTADTQTGDTEESVSKPVYVLDFFAGTALDLSQYKGKAIFLNFFTEWCPYCMEEMPDIKKIYDMYDLNSLVIILVHPWDGENETNTASVVAKYGLEGLTTVEDKDMAISQIAGIPGYPTSIFIDQNGYLFYAAASKLELDDMTRIIDGMSVPLRDGTVRQTPVPAKTTPSNSAPANSSPSNPAPDATTGATPKN